MLIKQDYENKFKNQFNSYTTKNKQFYNIDNNINNKYFSQNELNAILNAVGGNKNIYRNILQKLNINENAIEGSNNTKFLENQIDILQKQQKINIIKNNKLIEEINEIEKKNSNKNKEIDKLKNELEDLKKEYNYKVNITDNSDEYDKDNIDKITSKRIKFDRIEIDANKNKEDNS